MAKIISLRGDQHHQVFDLLPWYAVGQLDPADMAQVEAHLGGCADCQGELKFQRRLASELLAMPAVAEDGWPAMRQRIEQEARNPSEASRVGQLRRGWRAGGPWLGWATAISKTLRMGFLPWGSAAHSRPPRGKRAVWVDAGGRPKGSGKSGCGLKGCDGKNNAPPL